MQYCSLCNTEYNDIAKICPLDHCANCGSLDLRKKHFREYKKNGKANFRGFSFMSIFFSSMISYAVYEQTSNWINPLLIMIIFVGIIIPLIYLSQSYGFNEFGCKTCKFKKFQPLTNIKLAKNKITNEEKHQIIIEHFEAATSNKVFNAISHGFKYNKYFLIVGIAGVIVAFIIGMIQILTP